MANEVEIVITSTDKVNISTPLAKVEELKRAAVAKIDELNAKEIKLQADITQAERALDELKAKAQTAARDAELKITADIEQAKAKLDELRFKAAGRTDMKFDADITAAEAKLEQLQVKARTAGADAKIKVDADVASAEAKLAGLQQQIAAIPNARLKVDADVAAAIAKLEAVRAAAQLATQNKSINIAADTSIAIGAVSALAAAIAALLPVAFAAAGAVAGIGAVAGVGLGAAVAGFSGVGAAVKAMGQQATSGGGAVKASAEAIRSATRGVEDAERSLKAAQQDEKQAQVDLTNARREAAAMLKDLQRQTEDMALSQKDAALSVEEAQVRLDEVNKNGTSTDLERRRAALSLEEAQQRLKNTNEDAITLSEKKTDADRKGVEGSDLVVNAQKRVVEASEKTAVAVQRLADSQLKLQEAMKPQGGGGGAVDKLAEAMAKLTPAGREFAAFLRGFIDGPLKALRDEGQQNFLPGVQAGMKALIPIMNEIKPEFGEFSATLGRAFGGAAQIIGSLAPSLLDFANAALQGLSPLGGIMQSFATDLGMVFEKLTASGLAGEAMGSLATMIGAVLSVLPILIDYGTQILAVMGPDLTKVFEQLAETIRVLGDGMLQFAPAAGQMLVSIASMLPVLAELIGWLANLNPHITAAVIALGLGAGAFLKLYAAMSSAKSVLTDVASSFGLVTRGADGSVDGLTRAGAAVTRLGLALAAMQIASTAFGSTATVGISTATSALEQWTQTGQSASDVTAHLQYDLDTLADSTWYDKTAKAVMVVEESMTGLGGVFDESIQKANERLGSLDAALSQLVEGGKADQAAQSFAKLTEQAASQGIGIERLKEAFPQYQEALAKTTAGTNDAASANDRLRDSLAESANNLLGLRGAESNYFEALAQTKSALEENGATLNVHTQRGRDNRDALDAAAQAANAYLVEIQKNSGEGPQFQSTLASSRAALSQTAQSMGMGKDAADRLAAAIIAVPTSKTVKVNADTAQAMGALAGVSNAIANINGKTVTIRTVQETVYISTGGSTREARSGGGKIPGRPSRVDTVPAMLSQGEYVVNADSTSKWLPLLEQINAGGSPGTSTVRAAGLMPDASGGSGGGGGGGAVVLEIHSGGSAMDDLLVEVLRRAVRTRGGDVQVVLGQGASS